MAQEPSPRALAQFDWLNRVCKTTMRLLTKSDLDKLLAAGCQDPDCKSHDHTEVYLHCRHHFKSPTWTKYHFGGWLEVACAECETSIAIIEVAGGDADIGRPEGGRN